MPRYRTGPAWADRTPSYPATPAWGLPPVAVPRRIDTPSGPRPARLAGAAPGVVRVAGAWFVAAALAHVVRYGVLVWFSDRLAPWWVEAVTTALVWVTSLVAIGVAVAAAVTATAWLVETRRGAYAPGPDPRRRAGMWVGCLLPVVVLVRAPVYLEELRRASGRAPSRSALRRWWVAFAVNGALVLLALWRGSGDGPQAAADAVLLTALAALAAVWTARETRIVMRGFSPPSPRFTRRLLVKGIVGSSPADEE